MTGEMLLAVVPLESLPCKGAAKCFKREGSPLIERRYST